MQTGGWEALSFADIDTVNIFIWSFHTICGVTKFQMQNYVCYSCDSGFSLSGKVWDIWNIMSTLKMIEKIEWNALYIDYFNISFKRSRSVIIDYFWKNPVHMSQLAIEHVFPVQKCLKWPNDFFMNIFIFFQMGPKNELSVQGRKSSWTHFLSNFEDKFMIDLWKLENMSSGAKKWPETHFCCQKSVLRSVSG